MEIDEEYNKRFRELKKQYEGKYFRVLTDENRNMRYVPDKHELIYIQTLYQYLKEGDILPFKDYLYALINALDTGFITEADIKKAEKTPESMDLFKKKIMKEYNIKLVHQPEMIDIYEGHSVQRISNLGEYGGTIKFLGARIIPCKDLVEITQKEYTDILDEVKEAIIKGLN